MYYNDIPTRSINKVHIYFFFYKIFTVWRRDYNFYCIRQSLNAASAEEPDAGTLGAESRQIGRVSNVTLCHEVPNFLSHFMTCLSTSGEVSCFVVSL